MAIERYGREQVVALTSLPPERAPVVMAKGYGAAAEAVLQRARDNGLFAHASPELVNLLMHVDLDQHIPPQLYRAVAELLAWVHDLEQGVAQPQPG